MRKRMICRDKTLYRVFLYLLIFHCIFRRKVFPVVEQDIQFIVQKHVQDTFEIHAFNICAHIRSALVKLFQYMLQIKQNEGSAHSYVQSLGRTTLPPGPADRDLSLEYDLFGISVERLPGRRQLNMAGGADKKPDPQFILQ